MARRLSPSCARAGVPYFGKVAEVVRLVEARSAEGIGIMTRRRRHRGVRSVRALAEFLA